MVEVQCSSCHTRYRVDEQVLPEGTPTFKCSRCGHVFTIEPRKNEAAEPSPASPKPASRTVRAPKEPPPEPEPGPDPDQSSYGSIAEERQSAFNPERVPDQTRESAAASALPQVPKTPTADTRPPTGAKISTAELLSRSFVIAPEETGEGENFAFDFHEEPEPSDDGAINQSDALEEQFTSSDPAPRWAVGDDPQPLATAAEADRFQIGEPAPRGSSRSKRATPGPADQFVDEAAAPLYNRGVAHSARFFLALLFGVFVGFATMTMTIHTAPAAARDLLNRLPMIGGRFASPLAPARMVALHDVHSAYERGKDGKPILTIAGQAENVTPGALHTIGIAAILGTSPGKPAVRREVYCGNNLVSRTIGEMTSHEIDFFQGLPPPPTFTVDASSSCPFVIVFTGAVTSARRFDLTVTQARPAAVEAAAPAS